MAANGAQPTRHAKPPPTGPTPPAPAAAPPAPPNNAHAHAHSSSNARQPNGAVNGTHAHTQKAKKKAADPPPVDPSQMYETLKNRIAALEEEEVHEEEEERRFGTHRLYSALNADHDGAHHSTAEEAQTSVFGLEDNAIHQKYIELVSRIIPYQRHPSELYRITVCRIETHGA